MPVYLDIKTSFCTGFNEHDIKVTSLGFCFLYRNLPVEPEMKI